MFFFVTKVVAYFYFLIIQRFSLTDTIAYELKNVSLLSTPPPGKNARPSDSENELPNHNPKSFAIIDSMEEAPSSGENCHQLQSPIGRPQDGLNKSISRNLFGSQDKTTELLSVKF